MRISVSTGRTLADSSVALGAEHCYALTSRLSADPASLAPGVRIYAPTDR